MPSRVNKSHFPSLESGRSHFPSLETGRSHFPSLETGIGAVGLLCFVSEAGASCAAALVFCRDSGTEILVRDYDAPQIETFTEVRTPPPPPLPFPRPAPQRLPGCPPSCHLSLACNRHVTATPWSSA